MIKYRAYSRLLDLGIVLRIGGAPPPILKPLLGLVRDHVDSDFIRYVVLQQGRAARVLPASPKFCMHVM